LEVRKTQREKEENEIRTNGMKILFISHEASRTGAPIMLLNMLKWLKENTKIQFDILLLEGGPLENEFEKIADVYKQFNLFKPISLKKQLILKILHGKKFNTKKYQVNNFYNKIRKSNYSIIYGNTTTSLSIFEDLRKRIPNLKFVVHVHELFSQTKSDEKLISKAYFSKAQFIAASGLVKNNLEKNHFINTNIRIIYSFVNTANIKSLTVRDRKSESEQFIINGCGTASICKGYDIFILVAKRALQKYEHIPFLFKWIGSIPSDIKPFIEIDIKNAGLTNHIEFTDELVNPYTEFIKADLFLLTSREDSFPLVCLEHAYLRIPIICFENVSGITEFVRNDSGVVVPFLDIEATVDAIEEHYSNPTKRLQLGNNAHVNALKYDINIQMPKFLTLMENL